VRVDTAWEAAQPRPYGGDPASSKRAMPDDGRKRLPVVDSASRPSSPPSVDLRLWIAAPDLATATAEIERHGSRQVELELADFAGLEAALVDGRIAGAKLVRVRVREPDAAARLLALAGDFEVLVTLDRTTAPWLAGLASIPDRLALRMPTHDRLTSSQRHDVDLAAFFAAWPHHAPVEGVPACILGHGRVPRAEPRTLDTTTMTPGGPVEIFRFARRFVLDHYRVKSLRCRTCIHVAACPGLHVNYVRAHGFAQMQPMTQPIPSIAPR